jgi:hypothetical protein
VSRGGYKRFPRSPGSLVLSSVELIRIKHDGPDVPDIDFSIFGFFNCTESWEGFIFVVVMISYVTVRKISWP